MTDIDFDVVIMGGGPAGAFLGAFLARQTKLRVAIYEKEYHPREHIGESFSFRITPLLEEVGALQKVLASDIYVVKYGGYYAWGGDVPDAKLFAHSSFEEDGVLRWGIHCNRAEFDALMLEHARECGVEVFEGAPVLGMTQKDGVSYVEVQDIDEPVTCRIFVEAAGGRGNRTTASTKVERDFLSDYKNIAIWTHVLGGEKAETLPGDWNPFRERGLSTIGSYAFEDGWFWYIPVPKMILGERRLTHSLGLVTSPDVLKQPGKRYTDLEVFMERARSTPLLKDLIVDANPISDKLLTATNYSMVSNRLCDFDQGWILVGDSAFFVDPLFSSGVGFAGVMAASAASLIKWTLESELTERQKRDLWSEYENEWKKTGISFAFGIDQWYHTIARENPNSVYWNRRGKVPTFDLREGTVQALIDQTRVTMALRAVTAASSRKEELLQGGPYETVLQDLFAGDFETNALLTLHEKTRIRDALTIQALPNKGDKAPAGQVEPELARKYWTDPVKHGRELPSLYLGIEPEPCTRFENETGETYVCYEHDPSWEIDLRDVLRQGVRFDDIEARLSLHQKEVLGQLERRNLITVVR